MKNKDDSSVSTAWPLSKLNFLRELQCRIKMTLKGQLLGCSQKLNVIRELK